MKKTKSPSTIASNKKAKHEYFIGERFQAGLVLQGWEAKSLRAGKLSLVESYVLLKEGEAWLLGAHISPLPSASTHVTTDPTRTRKLLLHRKEIHKINGAVSKKGETCVALSVFWQKGMAKCEIALAKGKQKHDKRHTEKQRDWQRDKQRILRTQNK